MDGYSAANGANRDDRVPIHWGPDGYDAPGFIGAEDGCPRESRPCRSRLPRVIVA